MSDAWESFEHAAAGLAETEALLKEARLLCAQAEATLGDMLNPALRASVEANQAPAVIAALRAFREAIEAEEQE